MSKYRVQVIQTRLCKVFVPQYRFCFIWFNYETINKRVDFITLTEANDYIKKQISLANKTLEYINFEEEVISTKPYIISEVDNK